MTTKHIKLDVWEPNNVRAKVNQGEVNSRFLEIKITDKSQIFDLTGKTVIFYTTKPDGNLIFNFCEVLDAKKGIVNLQLTSQMSAVPGIMRDCEIDILDLEIEKLKIKGLAIEINRSTDFEGAIESTSEFTALEGALAQVKFVMDQYSDENIMGKICSMDGEGSGFDADLLDGKHGVEYASAQQGIHADTAIQGVLANGFEISKNSENKVNVTPENLGTVPISRKVNGKTLQTDVALGAAAEVHGNHVPALQAAHGAVFLRNDNSWQPVTPANIGAATIEQGAKADFAIQGLKANGTTISPDTGRIVDITTDDLSAVPIDRKINGKSLETDVALSAQDIGAAKVLRFTAQISANWAEETPGKFAQTVEIPGVLAADAPIVDLILEGDAETENAQIKAWNRISKIVTGADFIKVYSNFEALEISLSIQLICVR